MPKAPFPNFAFHVCAVMCFFVVAVPKIPPGKLFYVLEISKYESRSIISQVSQYHGVKSEGLKVPKKKYQVFPRFSRTNKLIFPRTFFTVEKILFTKE